MLVGFSLSLNQKGQDVLAYDFCSDMGYECGTWTDHTGGTVNCGTCSGNTSCGYYEDNVGSGISCNDDERPVWGCLGGTCTTVSCNYDPSCDICDPQSCYELGYECGTHDDGCGNMINCGTCNDYCDTSGDVHRYCSGNSVYGVYDFANRSCSSGSCHTNWIYNSCEPYFIEQCGIDYCEDWGNWQCYVDSVTGVEYRQREQVCYEQGCATGSCYSNQITKTEREDCVKDGSQQNNLPGKCVDGTCQYFGLCGETEENNDLCEKPNNNLCIIDFFEDPAVQYDDAGGDKSEDKFYWTCDGYDPDSTSDDDFCEIERDCPITSQRWMETSP
ncbi:MAG: hypothetical protein U5L10_01335 [Candidatus Moranbacteria bacterium]|nr:hypothetical protein [Candidatus Moranbacteria bacterium]